MKPRIFISAVTKELKTARQLVANTLLALGFEPVWQDIFETHSGDIRPMLREKLDTCSAVLQIVGDAYGAEPPAPDEQFGRVSYTQYEALYARFRGKKVYYLVAEANLPRDCPADQLDLPREDSGSARTDSAERKKLQQAYRANIQSTEHIFYAVQTESETELTVRRLKSDLEKLRRWFQNWMLAVSAAIVLSLLGVAWVTWGQQGQAKKLDKQSQTVAETKKQIDEQAQRLTELQKQANNPERTREQLQTTILRTYEKAIAEADKLTDWRKREDAKELAKSQRDGNLARVEEFLQAIVTVINSGNASPEYLEMTRIFNEQGAEEAVAYIESQQDILLSRWDANQAEVRKQLLIPILQGSRYELMSGNPFGANQLCDKILVRDPSWPDAIHEKFRILTSLGEMARKYEGASVAHDRFVEGQRFANQLALINSTHPEAQVNLLRSTQLVGYSLLELGRLPEAISQFEQSVKIGEQMATDNPRDVSCLRSLANALDSMGDAWRRKHNPQRSLEYYLKAQRVRIAYINGKVLPASESIAMAQSNSRVGDMYLELGKIPEAKGQYESLLTISRITLRSNPNNDYAQGLSLLALHRMSQIATRLNQDREALDHALKALEISRQLLATDHRNTQYKRGMSVSYVLASEAYLGLGDPESSLNQTRKALEIRESLMQMDPGNAQAKMDVIGCFDRLAQANRELGEFNEAKKCFEISLAIVLDLRNADSLSQFKTDLKQRLERQIADCDLELMAMGDLDKLLKNPAQEHRLLLALRVHYSAKLNRLADVDRSATMLLTLHHKDVRNQYYAANGFALCLKLVSGWSGRGPFPPEGGVPEGTEEERRLRKEYRAKAIAALKEAIALGWTDFEHMRKDQDLAALHGDPEFEALFPKPAAEEKPAK